MKYLRESDPQDVFDVFAIDIRYPSVCLELYLQRYERSLSDGPLLLPEFKETGNFPNGNWKSSSYSRSEEWINSHWNKGIYE